MSAPQTVTLLPTRPDADLAAVVSDVAHARRIDLSADDLPTVTAIAADILRGTGLYRHGGIDQTDDMNVIEVAAEEAVRTWETGLLAA